MWPFRSSDRAGTDPRLIERIETLERQLEAIDTEWSEWYDKYRRLYARIAKRAERGDDADTGAEKGPPSRQDAPRPTNGAQSTQHPSPRIPRNLRGF